MLYGLSEDYNSIVLMAFTKPDTLNLSGLESLLLVQESQLDTFHQELATLAVSANLAHTSHRGGANAGRYYGGPSHKNFRGRGHFSRGRARGHARTTGPRPTFQVCGKQGHIDVHCWYRFDENYASPSDTTATDTPTQPDAKDTSSQVAAYSKAIEGSPQAFSAFTSFMPSASTVVAIPEDIHGQGWYTDTCDSHNITAHLQYMHHTAPYRGKDKVLMGNGHGALIHSIGSKLCCMCPLPHVI